MSTKNNKVNTLSLVAMSSKDSVMSSVPNVTITLLEAQEGALRLQEFVEQLLIEGVDYGILESYNKPTLLKPGAEKLCDAFGFSKHVEVTHRIEDWDKGLFAYEVKVTLIHKNSGLIEAEGIGACNSHERAFAASQDTYTLVNTFLKMAKKRALVDAVLSATKASGIFTQDIESLPSLAKINERELDLATPKQLQMIFQLTAELEIQPAIAKELMHKMFGVVHSTKLTKEQASTFIQDLLCLKN